MNKVVHFEIPTKDLNRAKAFYGDIFGWKLMDMPAMHYTIVQTVEVDDKQIPKESGAINGGMTADDKTAKGPVIVIDVPSIDEYIKKIEAAGGKVVAPKVHVGDMGYYARFEDPEGNVVGIWENIKH